MDTSIADLEKEVQRLRIKVNLLEHYLLSAMSLPILGLDSTPYKNELSRALAEAGLTESR
jgi:hypothetical protein